MSQKSITSFFTPKNSTKRKSEAESNKENESMERSVKNRKMDETAKDNKVELKPSEEQIEMAKLFPGIRMMHPSWFKALHDVMKKEKFEKLADFVKKKRSSGTVYPKPMDVFNWTKRPLNKIKVNDILT